MNHPLQLGLATITQWWRTRFVFLFPSADFCRFSGRAYLAAHLYSYGGPFASEKTVGLLVLVVSVRLQSAMHTTHTGQGKQFTPGMFTIGDGMTAYIHWQHIPDRSYIIQ